jgi:hypothetical protein
MISQLFFIYREMCTRFADLERKLGEIDRARAVYSHASQICDPRVSVCLFVYIVKSYSDIVYFYRKNDFYSTVAAFECLN